MRDVLPVDKAKERMRTGIVRSPDAMEMPSRKTPSTGRGFPRQSVAVNKWPVPIRVAFIAGSAGLLWAGFYFIISAF